MLKGRIRNIPSGKMYGWISYRDENHILTDYFFHRDDYGEGTIEEWKDLETKILKPYAHLWVDFEVAESTRGCRAKNVKPISMIV